MLRPTVCHLIMDLYSLARPCSICHYIVEGYRAKLVYPRITPSKPSTGSHGGRDSLRQPDDVDVRGSCGDIRVDLYHCRARQLLSLSWSWKNYALYCSLPRFLMPVCLLFHNSSASSRHGGGGAQPGSCGSLHDPITVDQYKSYVYFLPILKGFCRT